MRDYKPKLKFQNQLKETRNASIQNKIKCLMLKKNNFLKIFLVMKSVKLMSLVL